MKFVNKFGTINVLAPTENFTRKTIGLSMSGGADSTMLCILLAKAIQEKGRKLDTIIQPFSGYDLWAPLDSAGLPEIITFIKSEFPDVQINWPLSVVFDTKGDHDKDKNKYIIPLVNQLAKKRLINCVISGISRGPELEDQLTFNVKDKKCAIQRIPGYRLWNEVSNQPDELAPYKHVDKRFVIQCYKDLGYESLLEKTASCTHPAGDCGVCWWCEERKWAINAVFNKDNQNDN